MTTHGFYVAAGIMLLGIVYLWWEIYRGLPE